MQSLNCNWDCNFVTILDVEEIADKYGRCAITIRLDIAGNCRQIQPIRSQFGLMFQEIANKYGRSDHNSADSGRNCDHSDSKTCPFRRRTVFIFLKNLGLMSKTTYRTKQIYLVTNKTGGMRQN